MTTFLRSNLLTVPTGNALFSHLRVRVHIDDTAFGGRGSFYIARLNLLYGVANVFDKWIAFNVLAHERMDLFLIVLKYLERLDQLCCHHSRLVIAMLDT